MNFLDRFRSRKRTFIAAWFFVSAALLAVGISEIFSNGSVDERLSFYVRSNQDKGVIIFVHGVTGNGIDTWTNTQTKAYWPDLLKADSTFNGYNIYVYDYPSALLGRSYSIDELTDRMWNVLRQANVTEHNEMIFLVHSMGGLITRGYLLKDREIAKKVSFIYFYSTPTTGSEIANVATAFSRNRQFAALVPMGGNIYVENQQSSWQLAKFGLRSFCAYESVATYGLNVVSRESGTNLCTNSFAIAANHIDIVKPKDQLDMPYRYFRTAFEEVHPSLIGKQ